MAKKNKDKGIDGQPGCKICQAKMVVHCWRRTGGWCGWWRCDEGCGLVYDDHFGRWVAERGVPQEERKPRP